MMYLLVLLAASLVAANAIPLGIDTQNVVTVPPNCPDGQEYINGQCRDVWPSFIDTSNVVVVPPNCPAGQQLINGVCRDVWRQGSLDIHMLVPQPYLAPSM
uniref:Uncharacterized protein n=1 Tax=Pectinophora gossypiella TaxID=13191 RepID=A0A1E1WP91_PECGO